jgi:ABC-type lipoprotein release transport system permease subunit
MWLAFIFALLIGGVLSILAALYPAWRAAKMPPAAALRSEF